MENRDEFILTGPERSFIPGKGGLGFEIFRSLNLHKEKCYQHIIETEEKETYHSLLQKSIRASVHLSKKNVKKGDIILLYTENRVDSSVAFVTSQFIGAIYFAIDPSIPLSDLVYIYDLFEPTVTFVSDKFLHIIEECLQKLKRTCDVIVLGKSSKYLNLDEISISDEEEKLFRPVFIEDLQETAIISLSSGTTGKPKGICVNHHSVIAQAANAKFYVFPKGDLNLSNFGTDCDGNENALILLFSPIHWISSTLLTLVVIFCGAKKVTGDSFCPEKMWKALKEFKPALAFLPPGQANDLLSIIPLNNSNVNFPDVFLVGGGLVTASLMEKMKRCFPKTQVIQGYGQTESTGMITSFRADKKEETEMQNMKPSSCGKLLPGMAAKLVNPDTRELCGPYEQGELLTKHPYLMNGYYKLKSESEFDSEGWLKTGDLAYYDDSGCVFIVDRLKDLLLYTVYNIRPSVIDAILAEHPSVKESLVFGKPHPVDNEHPTGVVVLKKDFQNKITGEELVRYVNERVPADRYKIRGGLVFVDEILKTTTGKVKKIEMKKLLLSGKFNFTGVCD